MPSVKRKNTEKVIVQNSISSRKETRSEASEWVMILTLLTFHFLLPHQVVIQMCLSEYWIRALLSTFVPKEVVYQL